MATNIAATVRAEVARAHVDQLTIGKHLGLTQSSVSRRMKGHTPFSAAELLQVAKLLDIPVARLYGDESVSA